MTPIDPLRYARQISLDAIGMDGQRRLADGRVLVIGAGGLGSPALHHLVASGVGTVGIVEFDTVDLSNVHRQTLFSSGDVGHSKIEAASRRLTEINPDVQIDRHPVQFGAGASSGILTGYDLVIDGSDTFPTRYAANDAAIEVGIPLVYASVSQFSGQASVLGWENGPCYRCLFPDPPPPDLVPSCEEGGVLGVVPAIMGTIQATEALKLILGIGEPLSGRLLMFDALSMEFRELRFDRDPACPACGANPRKSDSEHVPEVTSSELRSKLASTSPPVLLDVREASEHHADHIGGRLIPLGMLDVRAFEMEDARDRSIVVYCASGGRSAQAVRLLRERGYNASSLRGGLTSWRASEASS